MSWWLRFLLILCLVSPAWSASRIACASTGFTTATTWELVDASSTTGSSYLDSEAGTTSIPSPNPSHSSNFLWAAVAPTVDGVAVKFATRAAVASGTITVILRDVTGGADVKTVTVNVSDINATAPPGWYFFKFDSAVALSAANNYAIGVKSSAATQGTLYRDATAANWSRMLRTTTTAAPAANDQLHVLGEWTAAATVTAVTVTMDEIAATSYGPTVAGGPPQDFTIGKSGTLNWGTTAKTNYILYVKGILRIYPGGTMNIGTVGTPMPSTSTAIYQMDSAAAVDSGLVVDGTLNIYGATKANVATLLTADLAGAGAVLTLASTTGWATGDLLAIASTTQTAAQTEQGTILTVDSPTQVTLTAGVANAHSGTSPTQAEVINLTQNVKVRGASQALAGYILLNATAVAQIHYLEFYYHGSTTANKYGLTVGTGASGNLNMDYSSLYSSSSADGYSLYLLATADNVALDRIVQYSVRRPITVAATTGTWSLTNSTFIGGALGASLISSGTGTVSGLTIAGNQGVNAALQISANQTFTNLTIHSNTGGILASSSFTINTATVWRNLTAGGNAHAFRFNTVGVVAYLNSVTAFGNATPTIQIEGDRVSLYINGLVSNGDSTFATTSGIHVAGPLLAYVSIQNSNFSTVAGIKTAHTYDIEYDITSSANLVVHSWNTIYNGATVVLRLTTKGVDTPYSKSGLFSQKHGQVAGTHRRYMTMGNALTNTVTFRTASPSEELIPSSASVKMESGPKQAAVANGNTVTWSVWVYKSVGYAGAQPRLMLRANPAIGIAADTLLDTMAGGAGAWEELTGVTAAATDDGVFEAFVDCDTSGSIYVDDWSANGTLISENRGWWNGAPMIVAGGQPIGGDTYWWTGLPAVGFPPSGPAPGGATPVFNNPILISRRQRIGATQ